MTRAAPIAFLGREFDDFLFSPIRESGGRMPLTVLSALARQGVDPWQEAAKLAQLPRDDAATRLTAWIAALPGELLAPSESGTIAARLMAALPGRSVPVVQAGRPSPGKIPATDSRRVTGIVIFMAFLIGLQVVVALSQSPSQAGNADQPTPPVASQPMHAPVSDR